MRDDRRVLRHLRRAAAGRGREAIFGDPATIAAGAFRPDGIAHEVPGGYRISGRWPLASGSSHATWYVGGCVVLRNGEPVITPTGAPLMREMFFPADVVDVDRHVGLDRTSRNGVARLRRRGRVRAGRAHGLVPGTAVTVQRPLYLDAVDRHVRHLHRRGPLGIARHAIEEFIELADAKTPVLSAGVLADKAVAQDKLGRAHAHVEAARCYLTDRLASSWERVQAGHAPTISDRGELWLAAAHAANAAADAIGALYTSAGASAVYGRCALDRCLRDARTAAQHICTQEINFELAGRQLLGRSVVPSVWVMDYRGER